jgi:hypothetical protein
MAQALKENKILNAVAPPTYPRDILGVRDAESATVERAYRVDGSSCVKCKCDTSTSLVTTDFTDGTSVARIPQKHLQLSVGHLRRGEIQPEHKPNEVK